MMGKSHVFSGMAAGAAALPLLPFQHVLHAVGFVAVTGAAALLPDLDHHNSTLTNMWGPVTKLLHKAFNWLGRGHRNGTHDLIVSPLAFAALVFLASLHPYASLAALTFIIGFTLRAAEFAIPGKTFEKGWLSLLVAAGASATLVLLSDERLWWLPIAVALGVFLHVLGDAITPQGVPAPLSAITGSKRTWLSGPLTTNTRWEQKLIAPGFLVAAVALSVIGLPGGIGWEGVLELLTDPDTTAAHGR